MATITFRGKTVFCGPGMITIVWLVLVILSTPSIAYPANVGETGRREDGSAKEDISPPRSSDPALTIPPLVSLNRRGPNIQLIYPGTATLQFVCPGRTCYEASKTRATVSFNGDASWGEGAREQGRFGIMQPEWGTRKAVAWLRNPTRADVGVYRMTIYDCLRRNGVLHPCYYEWEFLWHGRRALQFPISLLAGDKLTHRIRAQHITGRNVTLVQRVDVPESLRHRVRYRIWNGTENVTGSRHIQRLPDGGFVLLNMSIYDDGRWTVGAYTENERSGSAFVILKVKGSPVFTVPFPKKVYATLWPASSSSSTSVTLPSTSGSVTLRVVARASPAPSIVCSLTTPGSRTSVPLPTGNRRISRFDVEGTVTLSRDILAKLNNSVVQCSAKRKARSKTVVSRTRIIVQSQMLPSPTTNTVPPPARTPFIPTSVSLTSTSPTTLPSPASGPPTSSTAERQTTVPDTHLPGPASSPSASPEETSSSATTLPLPSTQSGTNPTTLRHDTQTSATPIGPSPGTSTPPTPSPISTSTALLPTTASAAAPRPASSGTSRPLETQSAALSPGTATSLTASPQNILPSPRSATPTGSTSPGQILPPLTEQTTSPGVNAASPSVHQSTHLPSSSQPPVTSPTSRHRDFSNPRSSKEYSSSTSAPATASATATRPEQTPAIESQLQSKTFTPMFGTQTLLSRLPRNITPFSTGPDDPPPGPKSIVTVNGSAVSPPNILSPTVTTPTVSGGESGDIPSALPWWSMLLAPVAVVVCLPLATIVIYARLRWPQATSDPWMKHCRRRRPSLRRDSTHDDSEGNSIIVHRHIDESGGQPAATEDSTGGEGYGETAAEQPMQGEVADSSSYGTGEQGQAGAESLEGDGDDEEDRISSPRSHHMNARDDRRPASYPPHPVSQSSVQLRLLAGEAASEPGMATPYSRITDQNTPNCRGGPASQRAPITYPDLANGTRTAELQLSAPNLNDGTPSELDRPSPAWHIGELCDGACQLSHRDLQNASTQAPAVVHPNTQSFQNAAHLEALPSQAPE